MLNNFQLPFKFNLYLSTRITYIYISVFIKAKFHGTFFEKKTGFKSNSDLNPKTT